MQHVRLGRTGLQVSRICLGTMTFGLQVDEPSSFAILDHAAEKGITFLDTADAYPLGGDLTTAGRTEEIVGKWMKGKRDQYVVATKCFAPMGRNRWDMGNSRRHIMDAIDASLRRLQTDFIDLYQLHFDDPGVPLDESLGALNDLVRRQGPLHRLLELPRLPARARSGQERVARHRPLRLGAAALQPPLPRVRARAVPALPRRRHRRDPVQPDRGRDAVGEARPVEAARRGHALHTRQRGATYQDRYWHDNVFDTVDELVKVADSAGIPLPTLAVAWTLQHPAITSPIVGASRPEQLDATCAALDTKIEPDLLETLNQLTAPYRRGDAPR